MDIDRCSIVSSVSFLISHRIWKICLRPQCAPYRKQFQLQRPIMTKDFQVKCLLFLYSFKQNISSVEKFKWKSQIRNCIKIWWDLLRSVGRYRMTDTSKLTDPSPLLLPGSLTCKACRESWSFRKIFLINFTKTWQLI